VAISGKHRHLPPVALGTETRHVTEERARERVQCLREQQVVLLWGMGTPRCGEHLHARRGGLRGNQRTVLLLVRQKKFVRLAWSSEEGAIS
jgi:hypothetical protein